MSYSQANEPPGVPSQWRQFSIWNIDIIIIIFCRFQKTRYVTTARVFCFAVKILSCFNIIISSNTMSTIYCVYNPVDCLLPFTTYCSYIFWIVTRQAEATPLCHYTSIAESPEILLTRFERLSLINCSISDFRSYVW